MRPLATSAPLHALSLTLAFALAACGGVVTTPDSAVSPDSAVTPDAAVTPSVATAEDFPAAFARAMCEQLFRCPSPRDNEWGRRAMFDGPASCAAALARAAQPWTALRQSLAAGDVRYDPAAAALCLARMGITCRTDRLDEQQLEDLCPDVYVGRVARGAACHSAFDCEAGAWCERSGRITDAPCAGVCAPRVPVGAPCTAPASCARTGHGWSLCRAADVSARPSCATVAMDAPAFDGQPCGYLRESSERFTMKACQPGSQCVGSGDARVCQRQAAMGAPCDLGHPACVDGSLCLPGVGGSFRCQPVARATVARDRCGLWLEGGVAHVAVCSASDGLVCQSQRCMVLAPVTEPLAEVGAPCAASRDCASRLCDGATSRCLARSCGE